MTKSRISVDQLTIRYFWHASLRERREFVLSWLTTVGAVGLGVAVPYYVGKVLAALAQPQINITPLVYGLIISAILTILANRIAFRNFLSLQPKIMAYLQTHALTALLRRGTSYHGNHVSGKLVSDAIDYPNAYSQLSNAFFVDIMPFAAMLICGIIIVAFSSPILAGILLVMVVVTIGMSWRFRRGMTAYRLRRHAAAKEVTSQLADAIVNHQTVTAFGRQDYELEMHRKLNTKLLDYRWHDWHLLARDGNYRLSVLLIFEILFVLIVIHQVRQNPDLLAIGIFAFSYTVTLSNRLFQIGTMMRTVEEALLLAMPITELLQEESEIQDKPHAPDLHVTDAKIRFDKVHFQYTDSSQESKVFADLSLTIKPGEKVGLIGPSGGGKTTFTKLLLRFEDVQSGVITIDDQDIAGVTQVSLRENTGYVAQEPLLFHRSVKENIAYGKPDASLAEITEAARKAYALDFIHALPKDFDTIVGERGVKLSGGQRQRIAIARAILKDAPILILDEATSALDSESEQYIQKALWELMQHRTALVIAHRLSTIQRLDRIIVMDAGKVVEEGSHQELIMRKGTYARLWNHQSGGFLEE